MKFFFIVRFLGFFNFFLQDIFRLIFRLVTTLCLCLCELLCLAHDAIGRVDIDLSMFLYRSSSPNQIAGFFPIFDTMHGIRGELYVKIEVSLIPTTNSTTDVVFYASASGGVSFLCRGHHCFKESGQLYRRCSIT